MSKNQQSFASTEEESLGKYEIYHKIDPLPDIPVGLLSSGQIQAYIAKTGLVFPYFPSLDPKKEKVTSATMTMTIGSEVMYWDDKGKRKYNDNLKDGDEIVIRPNSITYLRPAERVNIPYYIAARFNLRIVHVHRGLLLGTGPLLDPGFKGYPMIPVHNLTENEYRVQVGQEFISVEFTKIEIGNRGLEKINEELETDFKYIENRKKTFDFKFPEFIAKNVPQRKVKSSLSDVIDQARSMVITQKRFVYGSAIGSVLAIAALIYAGYQLTISATSIIDEARKSVASYKSQEILIKNLQDQIKIFSKEIVILKEQLTPKSANQDKVVFTPNENASSSKDYGKDANINDIRKTK